MMMPNQRDELLTMVKKYMISEWPALEEVQLPETTPELSAERPEGMSLAYGRMILEKCQKDRDAGL